MPIAIDEASITVAIYDPLATDVHQFLQFHLRGKRVVEQLVTKTELLRMISEVAKAPPPPPVSDLMQIVAEIPKQEEAEAPAPVVEQGADGTVARLVNQLIADAVSRGASDIHIEPNGPDRPVTIRLRIDGECEDVALLPPSLRNVLTARLKIMSGLHIAERRRPQDGKLRLKIDGKQVELRVATLPTVNGNEDVVLRVLASSTPMKLDACGLSAANLDRVRSAIARPYGLILCVGPTGSG